jgi:uncharacterized membrane protein
MPYRQISTLCFFSCILFSFQAIAQSGSDVQGFSGTSRREYKWQICNRSSKDLVYVAIAYKSSADIWTNKGWYTVPRGSCKTLLTLDKDTTAHYYAENNGITYTWGNNSRITVSGCRGKAFQLYERVSNGTANLISSCPPNSSLLRLPSNPFGSIDGSGLRSKNLTD